MPVMDGFEMVKRYRLFEKEQQEKGINAEELRRVTGSFDSLPEEAVGVEDEENRMGVRIIRETLFIIGMSANSDVDS
jgi:lysyl-tRNA synthetase class II